MADDRLTVSDTVALKGRVGRSWLAWAPILILLAAIIAARAANLNGAHESGDLMLVLSFVFYTVVSLGTLFLIGRGFLASGAPGLLLLECGVVLWSLAGTVGDAVSRGDANVNVTIFNTCILLAGMCHVVGAIVALRPQRALGAKRLWLGAGCALALGVMGLVTWAALAHWLPEFFIPGKGGTPVRYCVLISAIGMFALSAGLLQTGNREKRTPFATWYAQALLLLAVGLFGVMIQTTLGSVVNWLGRTAQWLGGVYLLVAAVAALRESDLPLLPPVDASRRAYFREALAVVAVLAATAVRLLFLQALGTQTAFVTFYPAVILVALYGGLRAGLLATVLSAIAADYFWIEPTGQFAIGQRADWLGLAIFVVSGVIISIVTETMARARARAQAAEGETAAADERAQAEGALRQRAEEALRMSAREFRSLAEAMPQIVWATDPEGKNLYFNQQWVDYTGMTMEESYGDGWNKPFHPEDQQRAWEAWQRATGHNERYSLECRLRRFDGVYRWWLIRGEPMRGSDGAILKWFGTCTDIEDLKRGEAALREANDRLEQRVAERTAALRESEERFRGMFERHQAVKLVIDPESGAIVDANAAAASFYGYTREKLCALHIEDINQLPAEEVAAERAKAVAEQRRYFVFPHRLASGEVRWVEVYSTPVETKGRPLLYSIIHDITERKRAEEALRQSERLYRAIGESIDFGIWVCDAQGRNTYASESFLKLMGITQRQCSDLGWTDILHPDDVQATIAAWKQCVETGGPWYREHRFRGADGQWHPILACGVAVRDEHGEVRAWAGINLDISRIKEAEEAARDSEKRLRQIAHAACIGFFEWNTSKGTAYWSPEHYELFGWDPGAPVTWDRWLEAVHPEDRQRVAQNGTRLLERGQAEGALRRHKDEYRIVRADGAVVWLESDVSLDMVGGDVILRGSVRDITERKGAEEALQTAMDRFYAAFSKMTFGALLVGADNRIDFANQAFCDMFNLSENPADLRMLTSSEMREKIRPCYLNPEADLAHIKEIVDRGLLVQDEEILMQGGRTYLRDYIPVQLGAGKYGRLWIHKDISERKRAEEALRQSEAQFRALAEAMTNLAWWANGDGYITWYNRRWYEYTGTTPQQMEGWGWQSVHDPQVLPAVMERWRASIATGAPFDMTFPLRGADGQFRRFLTRVEPVKDAQGQVVRWFGTNTDVEELKRAEEALARTAEDLARSNNDLAQFAYVASHDLQEPLRMVAGYMQLLDRRYKDKLDADGREFIGFAVDGAMRMSRLITELLDYSRLNTRGKKPEPVGMEAVLKRALENLHTAIRDTNAEITHDPLPTVVGDATQLVQLFQNLIGNALKFRVPDRPVRVCIGAKKTDEEWVFSVKDEGIGFDPQYADKIFLIFQRLHNREEYPGTGIGLAICKKIVERHGGRIWVESQPGKGARFYFTLGHARLAN